MNDNHFQEMLRVRIEINKLLGYLEGTLTVILDRLKDLEHSIEKLRDK